MTSSKQLPFIVAGGGIGGLCAALALAKTGQHVKVLERAPEVGEIGFGIQIAPNGHDMLRRLGVMEALEPSVFYPDALVMVDALDNQEVTRINLGEKFTARYKLPYFVVHRRDLHGALMEACLKQPTFSIESGAKDVRDFEEHDGIVTVRCADGSSYDGCAMIGAEGLRSATRARIVPDEGPRPTGHVVYRGLVPIEEITDKQYMNSMVIYVGPGFHAVQYRLRGGTVMNNVATFESAGFKRGEKDYGTPEELAAKLAMATPEVQHVMRYLSYERKWTLYDLAPADNWTQGKVTLLGDAAHATLQYMAQGAIMAMEDSLVLAAELTQHGDDINAAFLAYQGKRMNRTARVVTSARIFGSICHASAGSRLLRNELARQRDPNFPWEVDWLYRGIDLPDTVAHSKAA
jgi:salicylate hydroxylase